MLLGDLQYKSLHAGPNGRKPRGKNGLFRRRKGRYALCTMCIGVGQGIAMIIESV